jgi:hypothetical protein
MGKISDKDLSFLNELRSALILKDVNPEKIELEKGVILVCCSDGDQMYELFGHQVELFKKVNAVPRIHTISLNGGGLLLSAESPLVKVHQEDHVLIKHITDARQLKGIHSVVVYAHAPCGAAGMANLSVEQVIDLLIKGRNRLKTIFEDLHVVPLFHLDDGQKKRTYFISPNAWEEWKIRN